jgi:hypothetical protein
LGVIRRALLAGLTGGVALSAAAFAGDSGDLALTGTVAQLLDIQVTPTALASGLDLATQQSALKVADVVTVSNTPGGYIVTVSSANVGTGNCTAPCFFSESAEDSLAFTLAEGTTALSFTAETATFAESAERTGAGGDAYVVNLSYDGTTTNLATAADYSETLTFTIALN